MFFHYLASQSDGSIAEGDMEAATSNDVLAALAAKGLRPISVKEAKSIQAVRRGRWFGQRITVEDKVFLTKYLALMLRVGTDLFRAIDILIDDFDKVAVKALLIEVRGTLEKGQPFYLTFSRYPKYFSPVFVNLIKAGEASGNLMEVFEELSVSLQKEQDLRQKVKAAMTYPIILFVASLLMLLFLVSFALPKIAGVFLTSSVQPPTFSKIVFETGTFLNEYMLYILAGLALLVIIFWLLFVRRAKGRRQVYHFFTRFPLIKKILKLISLQRFASTLGSLLSAGLPIIEGLEITADAVNHPDIKSSLIRISREGVTKGLGLGESFRREVIFPKVVSNLVAISEKAGHLEDTLKTLATFYESEIETSIKVLITFLEPAMLFAIGIVIGLIALSIIVPIYQLVAQFA